ncbi:putative apyrase 7 [Morella rubra]|uniref:Putative apyrase 7 n=1 Tax=Morella rubra TaxID=262757 RepID=A0A6A1VRQ4_9ROSI|nr:putative apyrase 7 [Morella rubra]
MVFGRIADVISTASSRFSASQSSSSSSSSTVPYVSVGTSPQPQSGNDFGLPRYNKNNLRLSSSLQDFSAYRPLAPQGTDLATHLKHPHSLQRENGGSSFSKDKGLSGGSPSKRNKWVRLLMLILCLALFGLLIYLSSVYVYSYWSQGASKFYVVLDCGSTGTRVYVYQASIDRNNAGTLPIVLRSFTEGLQKKPSSQVGRAYDRMETEPGFHKLVHDVSGLRAAIKPLVQWAEKQIPKHAHKTTSLFVYATAGVRRLPAADSKWLLDNAWSILKVSPFLCQRDWVKIISGPEEAYFGWIALNHRKHVLGAAPRKPTFGSLDLGGSSLQVTFESKEQVHNETNLDLRIGAANHHLTAYSLSGYGLNDAFDKSVFHLFKRVSEITKRDLVKAKIELKHPCLHSGYKEQYTCSQCALNYQEGGSPVIAGKNMGEGGKSGIAVQLVGAPNWEECSALAKIVVNLSEWSNKDPGIDCDLQPCALPDSFPRPYGQFYGMSGFFVVYRFFNLSSEATLDDVLEKGHEFCEKTWDVARNSVAPQPFIEQYCFRAPYIVLLLREGLHITDSQIIIGSGSITWTLGVALLEAGKAFSSRMPLKSNEILQMKINPIVIISILSISLVLLVCAFSFIGNWMPRVFRRSYLPLFRHNSAANTSVLNISSPFGFQSWSPISSGDGRVKMPLSPTTQERPFGFEHGLSGSSSSIQLVDSSLYPSTSSVSHSYSSSNLGQMQFDGSGMASFWSPHRGQMRLQSRRSQSREDLNSSLSEAHLVKAYYQPVEICAKDYCGANDELLWSLIPTDSVRQRFYPFDTNGPF